MAYRAETEDEANAVTLARLANELRAAVAAALAQNSSLASLLDSCRNDVERLTMMTDASEDEVRSVIGRCRMVLGAWRVISPPSRRQTIDAIDSSEWRICRDCNAAAVRDVTGPGRRAPYQGTLVEVPSWLSIPTCTACGAEQLDEEMGRQLDLALASAYMSGRR